MYTGDQFPALNSLLTFEIAEEAPISPTEQRQFYGSPALCKDLRLFQEINDIEVQLCYSFAIFSSA